MLRTVFFKQKEERDVLLQYEYVERIWERNADDYLSSNLIKLFSACFCDKICRKSFLITQNTAHF